MVGADLGSTAAFLIVFLTFPKATFEQPTRLSYFRGFLLSGIYCMAIRVLIYLVKRPFIDVLMPCNVVHLPLASKVTILGLSKH